MTLATPPPSPPAWVRAVDLLCLGLVILSVVVAMSGGFRIRVAGLRLSLTSPYRLLFWAIAIGLARHFVAPAIPIYRDLPRRLAHWRQSAVYSVLVVPDIMPRNGVVRRRGLRSVGFL